MFTLVRKSLIPVAILVLISMGTVFFRLGSLPFLGADEPRYARVAEEMAMRGTWVTPVLEGHPWLEKPPLYYWLTIPFFRFFGVSETTARLGSAFAGLVSCLAVFWVGSHLWSRTAGLISSAMLLTSLGYAGFARSASTDMPMTACLTIALSIFLTGSAAKDHGFWKTWCAYAFVGLAILAKGPVALILVAGIGIAFWCFDDRCEQIRGSAHISGIGIMCLVAMPWFFLAFRENGFVFIASFFLNHNLARYVSDIHHHTQPAYYYVPVLFGLFLPWSSWLPILMPPSMSEAIRNWRRWHPATLFLLCWALFPLLFFSFSHSKLPGYVLPVMPPLTLLLGVRLSGLIEGNDLPGKAFAWCFLALNLPVGMAIPFFFQKSYSGNWNMGILLSLCFLVPALIAFGFVLRGSWRRAVMVSMLQGVLLIAGITQFVFPMLGVLDSTKDIAARLESVQRQGEPAITYKFSHHTLDYYTGYRIAADIRDEESLKQFALRHRSFLVVAETGRLSEFLAIPGMSATPLALYGRLTLFRLISQLP